MNDRSGIDFAKELADFLDRKLTDLTEADFVARLEACRNCSLCRQSKCLATGGCIGRKSRAFAEICPKGLWPDLDGP